MRDYLHTLEQQLLELAATEEHSAQPARPPAKRPAFARRRTARLAIPGIAVVAAGVAGVLVSSGGPGAQPALAVPVLARPAVDVSNMSFAELLRKNHVDLSKARAVLTPTGTGYVVPDDADGRFCLIVPDPVEGYGTGCSTLAEINRRGLISVLSPSAGDPSSPATFVAVLPSTADGPLAEFADGTSETLELKDGVATLSTHQDATITYKVSPDSRPVRLPIHATHPNDRHTGESS